MQTIRRTAAAMLITMLTAGPALADCRVPTTSTGTSCVGVVLVASTLFIDASYVYYTGANLAGSSMAAPKCTNCGFVGINGARMSAKNAVLDTADFTAASLRAADFSEGRFTHADFTGADLTRATLTGASFIQAKLTGATLTNASLAKVTFLDTDLTGADLRNADLRGVSFSGTTTATGADFSGATTLNGTCLPGSIGSCILSPTATSRSMQ